MTREMVLSILRRLEIADGTEEELDDLVDSLEEAFPNGDVDTLLFRTKPELSNEEIVSEIFRRQGKS